MPTTDDLKARIESSIPGARAEVVSPAFAGLSRIAQHKLVYDVFGADIGGPIHALSLSTRAEQ